MNVVAEILLLFLVGFARCEEVWECAFQYQYGDNSLTESANSVFAVNDPPCNDLCVERYPNLDNVTGRIFASAAFVGQPGSTNLPQLQAFANCACFSENEFYRCISPNDLKKTEGKKRSEYAICITTKCKAFCLAQEFTAWECIDAADNAAGHELCLCLKQNYNFPPDRTRAWQAEAPMSTTSCHGTPSGG